MGFRLKLVATLSALAYLGAAAAYIVPRNALGTKRRRYAHGTRRHGG